MKGFFHKKIDKKNEKLFIGRNGGKKMKKILSLEREGV